ncbi:MAG: hypothetical protein CXZ00_16665 [Acidobacteria bacterium]|nr:MAG: hypothetical protein CXZ00_16665 [Acidobacteriota bacterium]
MAITFSSALLQSQRLQSARNSVRPFQNRTPVDVTGIAGKFGLNVWELSDLDETVSGKLFIDLKNGGTSGFSIGVNAREGYTRKRFTVAHELAHFLLHRDQLDSGIQDDAFYRSKLSSRQEVEANKLAADILMPHHLIKALQAQGVRSVDQLASELEVSVPAMKIRLGIPVE